MATKIFKNLHLSVYKKLPKRQSLTGKSQVVDWEDNIYNYAFDYNQNGDKFLFPMPIGELINVLPDEDINNYVYYVISNQFPIVYFDLDHIQLKTDETFDKFIEYDPHQSLLNVLAYSAQLKTCQCSPMKAERQFISICQSSKQVRWI